MPRTYFDTETFFVFDKTWKQLVDDVDKTKLCHRSVAKCGEQCEMLMHNHVKLMLGKGERLDHEFMKLNDTLTHYRSPHLRLTVESFKGVVWKNFTASTIAGGAPGRWKLAEWSSFTDFNAMGAVMWRDFHDRVHWIDITLSEFDTMILYFQSWSGQKDEAKRKEDKRRFECVRKFQHNAEKFDVKNRVRTCTHEAVVIKSSCTCGDLENDVSLTMDIFMRTQIPISPKCASERIVAHSSSRLYR